MSDENLAELGNCECDYYCAWLKCQDYLDDVRIAGSLPHLNFISILQLTKLHVPYGLRYLVPGRNRVDESCKTPANALVRNLKPCMAQERRCRFCGKNFARTEHLTRHERARLSFCRGIWYYTN